MARCKSCNSYFNTDGQDLAMALFRIFMVLMVIIPLGIIVLGLPFMLSGSTLIGIVLLEPIFIALLFGSIYITFRDFGLNRLGTGICPQCRNMAVIKGLNENTPYGNSLPMPDWKAREIVYGMQREQMVREQKRQTRNDLFEIVQWMFIWRVIFNAGRRR
jgi:hypothetical protein